MSSSLVVLILNLGGQVVANVANVLHLKLHHKGHIRRHAQLDLFTQAGRFCKGVQVPGTKQDKGIENPVGIFLLI